MAGGILAGPAILDCSHQPAGIGACLRAKVQDAGFLPDDPSSAPAVSVQTAAPPAETRPQGWLEANANEYEAPASTGSADLSPPIGTIGAVGIAPITSPGPRGAAAITAPTGDIAATGQPLPAPDATAEVALAQPIGRLSATGTIVAQPGEASVDLNADPKVIGATGTARPGTPETSADVAVIAPPGRISVDGLGAPKTSASAFADPAATAGAAAITGSITSAATMHGTVALEAEAEIPQAIPAPVLAAPMMPALPVPKAVPKPAVPKAATATPPKTGPKRVLKADPRYPNVIVLPPPPPISAANSSFATLELR